MESAISIVFLEYSCRRLDQLTDNLRSCMGVLSEEQVWERHGEHENAVGNLILHLCGNARQWVIH